MSSTVPTQARNDPRLYELLALVDVMRIGRAWERTLAEQHLKRRLRPWSRRRPSSGCASLPTASAICVTRWGSTVVRIVIDARDGASWKTSSGCSIPFTGWSALMVSWRDGIVQFAWWRI